MTLYENNCSDMDFHFILKEDKVKEATRCLSFSKRL